MDLFGRLLYFRSLLHGICNLDIGKKPYFTGLASLDCAAQDNQMTAINAVPIFYVYITVGGIFSECPCKKF